jgi:hypothetical protein
MRFGFLRDPAFVDHGNLSLARDLPTPVTGGPSASVAANPTRRSMILRIVRARLLSRIVKRPHCAKTWATGEKP